MDELSHLFENNRKWAEQVSQEDARFFEKLVQQQSPEYLWIGCSDSRVPPNELVGIPPGGMFVHRNVSNLVIHSDMNCLSVLQYAVEVLRVKHIIVCGHYGCGGVEAAIDSQHHGLIDNWLRPIRDTYRKHSDELTQITDNRLLLDRLCELNVVEQVINAANTTIVQHAWLEGQPLTIHGWIYSISNGLLKDLDACISSSAEAEQLEKGTTQSRDYATPITQLQIEEW